jgi:hypothetical protein
MCAKVLVQKVEDLAAHLHEAWVANFGGERWWADVLCFKWDKLNKGKNNTMWGAIQYRTREGVWVDLSMAFHKEVHVGQILHNGNAGGDTAPRAPALQIRMSTARVEGIVTPTEDGLLGVPQIEEQLIAAGLGDTISKLFMSIWYINDAFQAEVAAMLDRGSKLVGEYKQMMGTPAGRSAFQGRIKELQEQTKVEGRRIMMTRSESAILGACASVEAIAIVVSNSAVPSVIQTRLSAHNTEAPNALLKNPMARLKFHLLGEDAGGGGGDAHGYPRWD